MPMVTEQFLKHQEIDVSAPHALTQSQSLIRPGCRPSDNGANCWHSGRRSSSEPRWVGFATWSLYESWGTFALAFATWVCFRLGLKFATTAFVYLIFIVLLSLMDSFISSAVFSVVAVRFLNDFFTEPLFTFDATNPQDFIALAAFPITSLAVTGLVRRVSRLGKEYGEQAL